MAETSEKRGGWKAVIKVKEAFAPSHRNKDGHKLEKVPSQALPETPRTTKSPRRASFQVNRQPTLPSTSPPENDELEKSRQERKALERGLSQDSVSTDGTSGHPDSLLPGPPTQQAGISEGHVIPRRPTNGPQPPEPLVSLNGSSVPSSMVQLSQGVIRPPNGTCRPVYSEPANDYDPQHLRQLLEAAQATQKKLEKELDDERAAAQQNWEWYQRAHKQNEGLSKLEGELRSAKRQLAENQVTLAEAQAVKEGSAAILAQKDADYRNLQKDMSKWQTSYDQVFDNAQQLSADLRESRDAFKNVNDELLRLKTELKSNVDDDTFAREWENLHAKIQNLTNAHFRGRLSKPRLTSKHTSEPPPKKGLPPPPAPPPKRLTDIDITHDHDQYINSEAHRPLLIQAFIWWTLTNKVFDHTNRTSCALYWAGSHQSSLSALKAEMRPRRRKDWAQSDPYELQRLEAEAKQYHKWRASTAILLLQKKPAEKRLEQQHVFALTNEIMDVITPYITTAMKDSDPHQRTKISDAISKTLDDVITSAITLDAVMHKQLAWIYCEQWSNYRMEGDPFWGFKFDMEQMEAFYGPSQSKSSKKGFKDECVEMVVQPALVREGDMFGENYAGKTVLCKAKVVVGENPTLMPSRRR